ncbi:hypothetical protein [Motiliproteus sp. MSK22-1]|uniref:hypothetical protein n=1 Tax=Motiliproteus sp. MSK22-1 TaxID=1897630 RepID=UPI000975E81B|nr:hypothetical protein [Motiliproteus sp. MSK22-1]OMH25732.1 hypothetical protein BGP75_24680 [Motiliproteus sp. MSK22-1]
MPEKQVIERLEALVQVDKRVNHALAELDKGRDDLREVKSQLKALKSLDPERLKKNLAESKKKIATKNDEIKLQKKELAKLRKELREVKAELSASSGETNAFYTSSCKQWELFTTGFKFSTEKATSNTSRVRCLNRETGTSVIASALNEGKVSWSDDIGVPNEVSEKAAEYIAENGLSTSRS